jgi:hypothetical protein
MTNKEKADFYAENPTLAAITQFFQNIFGRTGLGMAQSYFVPDFVEEQGLIPRGIDPAAYQAALVANRGSELLQGSRTEAEYPDPQDILDSFNAAYAAQAAAAAAQAAQAANATNVPTQQDVQDAFAAAMSNFQANAAADADAAATGYGGSPADVDGGGGGSFSDYGLGFNDSAAQAAADADAAATGYGGSPADADSGPGGYSGGYDSGGYDGFAKGGKVTKNRLRGPDPKGPDQGYGALLSGEYVIKKSAVKKYGEGLLGMINEGKIPVQKIKSLLG